MVPYSFYTDQLNSTVHVTMEKSPYELVFGQPPRQNIFPGVKGTRILEEDVADILENEDEHPERDYNLHHKSTPPVLSKDRDSDLYHKLTPAVSSEERDSDLYNKSTPPVPSEERDSNIYNKSTPPVPSEERDSNIYNKSTPSPPPPVPSEGRVSNHHHSPCPKIYHPGWKFAW